MSQLKDESKPVSRKLRFGVFEVDLRSGSLYKHGIRIPLQRRPFQALVLLLQNANEVVTRKELQKRLWSEDVFVDFDHGLNTAIRKIRLALNDDAAKPRFIETIGREGYRFLVSVELDQPIPDSRVAPVQTGEDEVVDRLASSQTLLQAAREFPSLEIGKPNRRIKRWVLAGSVLTVTLLIAYRFRPLMPLPRVTRITQLTKSGSAWHLEPLYTDGPRVYYQSSGPLTADWQLHQVLLNGNEDTPAGTPAGRFRIRGLSADDTEFVATDLTDGQFSVWRLPLAGGSPRRVGNLVAADIAWSHEGSLFAYSVGNQLFLTDVDGASSRSLVTVAGGIDHIRWSPDDRRLRFTLITSSSQSLWEVHADGSSLHEISFNWPGTPMECCGDWTPDGRYFVFRSGRDGTSNLWMLQEKSDWWRRTNPDPVQLTSGPMNYLQPVPSRNGRSIFAIAGQPFGELVRYDAKRKEFVPYLGGRSLAHLSFSPDGQWLAYVDYPEGTLWRARSDGTQPLQLTFPPAKAEFPRWSADNKRIAFDAFQPGQMRKSFLIAANGGNPEPFPQEPFTQATPDWMPGGNALIFGRSYGAEHPALYLFDLRSGRREEISGSKGLYGGRWSPDGRYLAAADATSDGLVLVDLKSGQRTPLGGPAYWGAWSPDSQYIYFLRWGVDWILRVHVPDGREERILQLPFRTAAWPYTVAPDGSLIVLRELGRADVYALSLSHP